MKNVLDSLLHSVKMRFCGSGSKTRILRNRLNEQTLLVEDLLYKNGIFTTEDIENLYNCTDGADGLFHGECKPKETCDWFHYPVSKKQFQCLDKEGITYLNNEYGAWIAYTSADGLWKDFVAKLSSIL